jgi:hypothetical protein
LMTLVLVLDMSTIADVIVIPAVTSMSRIRTSSECRVV